MSSRFRALGAALLAVSAALPVFLHGSVDAAVTTDAPRRVLDTRIGMNSPTGRLSPGRTLRIDVAGVAPGSDTVVVLNLTSDGAAAPGFVSARPCDAPSTDTSILNVYPGRAVPNAVALAYNGSGLCFDASTQVHLIADLTAVSDEGDIRTIRPDRIFDSRESRPLAPGRVHRFDIAATPGVADRAAGAALNITVVDPVAAGYVLVQPCGGSSKASTMNFLAGEVVPHFTFTGLDDGDVCITTLVETDLIVDVFGWMPSGSGIELITPNRALDTRTGFGGRRGGLSNGDRIEVQIGGRAGTKNGATNAVVNVVGVDSRSFGFLKAWPCDQREPTSSIVNLWPGSFRANQAMLALSDGGTLCLRARVADASRVDVVIDVVGYTGGTGTPPPPEEPPPLDPPTSDRFETLPVGAALPSGAECEARVRPAAEVRPVNATANSRRGSRANANTNPSWPGFTRVDGNFAGSTDEIIQWAACKWGIDEDIARAQVIKESYWYQSNNGDNGESWGLGQVRDTFHQSAFQYAVNARTSSAYNLDYTYAVWRACYEGAFGWLNEVEHGATYGPGDAWGCMGAWFSGRWYIDIDAYLNQPGDSVRFHYENRTWETDSFING